MVLSMERWKGKVAVVTGASSGCGRAIAEALLREGLIVAGLSRRSTPIAHANFHARPCDIRSEEDIKAAFAWAHENLGPVSILVNSAGLSAPTTLIDGDADMWRAVLETNVLGLATATREAIASMRRGGVDDGHVVHVNSILGHYVAFVPGVNVYSASKHAVTALTETLRQELLKSGTKIRISSVSPGPVDTPFLLVSKDEADTNVVSSFPKLNTDDVADAVIYVVSTPPHVQVQDVLLRPLGEPV